MASSRDRMSGSTRKGERNKNDTWGEKELSKYITGSGKGSKDTSSRKKTTVDAYGSYGSPKPQAKKVSTTGVSTKQSASSVPKESGSPLAGPRQSSRSGGGKTAEDKARDRSGGKSKTVHESRGNSSDSRRVRQGEASTKRSSKDGKSVADSKASSSRGKESSRIVESKTGKGRVRESQEAKGHRQSSERDKDRRKDDSRVRDKGKRDLEERKRDKEAHKRNSGSRDRESKHHRTEEKKREIKVREDPPQEDDGIESDEEEGEGGIEGNPPQQMVEVTEEVEGGEYQYEDEEFEDFEYEEDFDEVVEDEETASSQSEDEATPTKKHGGQATTDSSTQRGQQPVDLLAIMEAIDAENMGVKSSSDTNIIEPSFENVEGTVIVKFTPNEGDQEVGHSQVEQEVKNGGGFSKLQSPSRKFVDFSHAQRNETSLKISKKARKRAQELLSMIELDFVSHDMFDLPPLSEYELYVKKFGADDTRQVSVQTGEDNQEGEAQTEPISTEDRWVQWPPEDLRGWGRGGDPCDNEEDDVSVFNGRGKMEGEDAIRLITFLKKAGQVCSVLLEENLIAIGQSPFHSTQSQFPFCSSTQRIQAVPPFISGRQVRWIDFSSTQHHLLLSAYSLPPVSSRSAESGLRGKGLVCLWNTRDPLQPQMVLSCESSPTCCCFSPQKSSLAFAGNEDGSVVLWDLREPLSMHRSSPSTPLSPRGGDSESVARAPTFSTAGASQLDNHHAPIVSITPISTLSSSSLSDGGSSGNVGDSGGHEVSGGLSFQLATLDRSGHLNIWVVVELTNPDPYGSEADLGLVPGGRVKLVKSTSINVNSHPAKSLQERSVVRPLGSVQVFCMEFHPLDTSHVYVGADTGRVCHVTRYGKRPIPRYYLPTLDHRDAVCDVLSMSFSHRQPDHFLAGCSDGSLKLYHTKRATPLLSWNAFVPYGATVVQVHWVETLPGVFLVQDSFNTLYMWDLLQNDSEPAFKETQKSRISYCKVHCQNHAHQSPSPPILVLAHEDNSITLHQFKELSEGISEREEMFADYLITLL